jgi:CheY-like chemotaxis protein
MVINVLIAEDEEATREMLVELLEREGMGVYAVADGDLLVERAGKMRYDIILSDNHMPRMNGVDAIRQIRNSAGPNKVTPALLVTGIPMGGSDGYWAEVQREADELGIRAVIQKPFSVADLIRDVHEYTQK